MSDSDLKMQERIKIDLRTPMEQFFLGLMLLSPVFVFIGFHQMKLGDSPMLFSSAILTFVLSFFCYFATDNLDATIKGLELSHTTIRLVFEEVCQP